MNLAFDKWIPCHDRDGIAVRASILECFQNRELAGLDVKPHERVAVMRLLECVAYAAAGIPEDYEAWQALPETLAASVERYLEQWRWAFNLMDAKRPFLQIPDLQDGAASAKATEAGDYSGLTPVSKLSITLATGNNSTLFDHGGALSEARQFDEETLALWLLAFQNFNLGGTVGVVRWRGVTTTKTGATDCPCCPRSMLHTFIQGETLAETLWLNLLTEEDLTGYQKVKSQSSDRNVCEAFSWEGRPVWERPPMGPDDEAARENATRTFLGRLVPLGRLVRIMPDRQHILWGSLYKFPGIDSGFPPEPTASPVIQRSKAKEAMGLLGFQPGQRIWRQLAALSVKRNADADNTGGCAALNNIPDDQSVDILVCAVARDNAAFLDCAESVFRIRAGERDDAWHRALENEMGYVERVNKALAESFRLWRHEEDGGFANSSKQVRVSADLEMAFFGAAERLLPLLMQALDLVREGRADGELAQWERSVRQCAVSILDDYCSQTTPRQIMAYTRARALFMSKTQISKE